MTMTDEQLAAIRKALSILAEAGVHPMDIPFDMMPDWEFRDFALSSFAQMMNRGEKYEFDSQPSS